MAISFNQIPNNIRVPLAYIEIDNSNAVSGASTQGYKGLILGQMLSTGTGTKDTLYRLTSLAEANTIFGEGSHVSQMVESWLNQGSSTELWAIGLEDDGSAIAASATFQVDTVATKSGALSVYVAGKRYAVAVLDTETTTDIATNIAAAINADSSALVTAVGAANVVTITAKNGGEVGNTFGLSTNYNYGETDPEGLTYTITDFATSATGAINPSLSNAIVAMANTQFNVIAMPYSDATSLSDMRAVMVDRFGPLQMIEGHVFTAIDGDFATLSAWGETQNDQHLTVMPIQSSPSTVLEWSASVASLAAAYGSIDPARPFQFREIKGLYAPKNSDQWTWTERNQILYSGLSSFSVNDAGQIMVERLLTTYQISGSGAEDISYLDLNTMLTLSYLRYDLRTFLLLRFPNHKLANDGTAFGAGQVVATPKLIKGAVIERFRQWEDNGLVEDVDQFKTDLIVERNTSDPNRVDILCPPNLINQLRVIATQIQFLL